MFGFLAQGNAGQVILGDDNPVLTQVYSGRLYVNALAHPFFEQHYNGEAGLETYFEERAFGMCEVTYPAPLRCYLPPMVFGVPTPAASNKGIGYFCHRGSPGYWTGFTLLVTKTLFANYGTGAMYSGFDSGWQYRVCVFANTGVDIPIKDGRNTGLRLFNSRGECVFDSRWPLVPFRNLLSSWVSQGMTRRYAVEEYWGNRFVRGDVDYVLAMGAHYWGVQDSERQGLLLSSLGALPFRHDTGKRDVTTPAIVTVGFAGGDRSYIHSVAYMGASQHPNGDVSAMNTWRILTADFSRT